MLFCLRCFKKVNPEKMTNVNTSALEIEDAEEHAINQLAKQGVKLVEAEKIVQCTTTIFNDQKKRHAGQPLKVSGISVCQGIAVVFFQWWDEPSNCAKEVPTSCELNFDGDRYVVVMKLNLPWSPLLAEAILNTWINILARVDPFLKGLNHGACMEIQHKENDTFARLFQETKEKVKNL